MRGLWLEDRLRPFLAELPAPISMAPAFDLREFVRRRAPEFPIAASQPVLMLTSIYDADCSVVGVELLRRGVDYIRINAEELVDELSITFSDGERGAEGRFSMRSCDVSPAGVRSVFVRYVNFDSLCEPVPFDSVEARFIRREWQTALAVFSRTLHCEWVNPPHAAAAASSDRLLQLQCAREAGFDVPRTLLTNDARSARSFYDSCRGGVIAKSASYHFVEVGGQLFNFYARLLRAEDLDRLDELRHAPAILQEYVPKSIEIRVTVVADRVFATELHSQTDAATREDYHRGNLADLPKAAHDLPEEIRQKCLRLMNRMGLVFGGLDLVRTPDGRYVFLEVNPEASWRWVEADTELPITKAVAELLVDGTRHA